MKKNKTKLAFELLEQEMEVVRNEDLMKFIGGSGGYTWQQFVNDIQNGNFNNVPAGSYLMNNDGTTTIYGGMLNEVVVSNHSSGGYGYSSSGNYSSNGYLNDPYFMNSQFWMGSGGYSGGGYGGGYYVSPTYVAGTGSIGSASSGVPVPPTDCVFKTLGWISAMMFGDQSHDSKYYEQYYNFTHPSGGTDVLYNYLTNSGGGVPPDELLNFVKTFFNATDYSGASNEFLTNYVTNTAGNQELIGVYKTPTGGLHMVNVTQINGTTVGFFDAQNPTRDDTTVDMTQMVSFIGITK